MNPILASNIAQRTFEIINSQKPLEMVNLLQRFNTPPHQYKASFARLVDGCYSSGLQPNEYKVGMMSRAIETISEGDPETKGTLKTLAKSTFKSLTEHGYSMNNIIFFTSEMVDLVIHELKTKAKK